MNTTTNGSRQGFTLVEVLAALTLTSLMMAVVLGLILQVKTTNDFLQSEKPFVQWHSVLQQQLQEDYSGCRLVDQGRGRLLFTGYSKTANGMYAPSQVSYEVRSEGEEAVLVRIVKFLDAPLGTMPESELVCQGVTAIQRVDQWSKTVAPGTLRLRFVGVDNSIVFETTLVRHGAPNE